MKILLRSMKVILHYKLICLPYFDLFMFAKWSTWMICNKISKIGIQLLNHEVDLLSQSKVRIHLKVHKVSKEQQVFLEVLPGNFKYSIFQCIRLNLEVLLTIKKSSLKTSIEVKQEMLLFRLDLILIF